MLIAVRHGKTHMNENGSEKMRGWLPIPLTLEGMKDAHDTGEILEEIEGITAIFTSDLVRAVQSATEIGNALNMMITPMEELRDWNTGDYAGQSVKDNLDKIHAFIDSPNKKIPGGESYQQYLDRTIPFLKALIEDDELHLVVTHNRTMTLLRALCKNGGEYPDNALLKRKAPVEPSGFILINQDWEITYAYKPDDLKDSEIDKH